MRSVPDAWTTRSAATALIMAACLLAQAGCRSGGPAEESPGHDDNHAGHVIPAHKPRDFPTAVRRLQELNQEIHARIVAGQVTVS